jgi:anti-anti-sigma factor
VQIISDEDGGVLRIQGTLEIGVAAEFRETLCNRLAETSSLVLDLSGLDGCDTAAIQLLYSASKAADSAKRLRFVGLDGAVAGTAAALGLRIGELTAEGTSDPTAANEAPANGI